MSDAAELERRYRRLLALYPAAFRREHEQEMLSVLLARASEGQRRPRLRESADLVMNAPSAWVRQWATDRRHPRLAIGVRVVVGTWLLVAGAIAYSSGYWWGVLFLAPATLHFYLAYRLRRLIRN